MRSVALSWKFALVTYDATQGYESRHGSVLVRAVPFPPPQVRDVDLLTPSTEPADILHQH
jgi:hypothetical protein